MFPLEKFRLLFPQFASVTDEKVNAWADWAKCLADTNGCACTEQIWMLLVAHLIQLSTQAENGTSIPGALASATVEKVSVSFQPAPGADGWSHWLNLTPWGQQALALMAACSAGGMYVGGLPERAGFTSVGGSRGGRW